MNRTSLPLKIGIVGATGLVGQTLLQLLAGTNQNKGGTVDVFTSREAQGRVLTAQGKSFPLKEMNLEDLASYDALFFATDAALAKEWIPLLAARGVVCIDKSSAFRDHPEVPLIVPEINGALLKKTPFGNIVSSPNCVAIPLALVLKPLETYFGIERVIVSTYQSVSGAGWQSLERLASETENSPLKRVEDLFNGVGKSPSENPATSLPLAFNVIPQIGSFDDEQNSDEERKVRGETLRILENSDIPLALTCVRVPTWVGHSLSVSVELKKTFSSLADVEKVLQNQRGLVLSATPFTSHEAQGKEEVFVSRVRPCLPFGATTGISLWATTDNLKKGAALNALQILETCFDQGLFAPKNSRGLGADPC